MYLVHMINFQLIPHAHDAICVRLYSNILVTHRISISHCIVSENYHVQLEVER
jgi:hypothetical protein